MSTPKLESFTIFPDTVTGGDATTGNVVLDGPAPDGGVVVNVSSRSPFVEAPATVTVSPGQSSESFPIGTKEVLGPTEAIVRASIPDRNSKEAKVHLVKEDGKIPVVQTAQSGGTAYIACTWQEVPNGTGYEFEYTCSQPAFIKNVQSAMPPNFSPQPGNGSANTSQYQASLSSVPAGTYTINVICIVTGQEESYVGVPATILVG